MIKILLEYDTDFLHKECDMASKFNFHVMVVYSEVPSGLSWLLEMTVCNKIQLEETNTKCQTSLIRNFYLNISFLAPNTFGSFFFFLNQ